MYIYINKTNIMAKVPVFIINTKLKHSETAKIKINIAMVFVMKTFLRWKTSVTKAPGV